MSIDLDGNGQMFAAISPTGELVIFRETLERGAAAFEPPAANNSPSVSIAYMMKKCIDGDFVEGDPDEVH